MANKSDQKSALIIGASKGLGLAIVQELLSRGWSVTGTVRQKSGTPLHALAQTSNGKLAVEMLDITSTEQTTALKKRLGEKKVDLLFVNAGIANSMQQTIADVPTEEFTNILVTNTLSPMRVIEALQSIVTADGTIGVMSSGQGSLTNNIKGGNDVYRSSKAALNMIMRSFAARQADTKRSLLLIAPGWIKTDMGGEGATYTIEEAIPRVVNTIIAQEGKPGLQYLDQFGVVVPW